MYGAIIGDIIGAPFEFVNFKSKQFPLFCKQPRSTDDTCMTVAVCDALMKAGFSADQETVKANVIASMKYFGRKYPHEKYGQKFYLWLARNSSEPYNSCGNGSAMRVSSVGWLYDSLERTRQVARWTAEVTHNHPEGVKGAESVASAIFLARSGNSKDKIREFIAKEFGYDLKRTLEQIRPGYFHVESCQESVPESIIAFLESNSFEDAVRNAVSLGGDTDTMACIAGAIAEAFYARDAEGVSVELKAKCKEILHANKRDEFIAVIERFDSLLDKMFFYN
ncbi:MAG: ADP-ribosylglycohydrolase family protein [Treponema sp.]|nr:ADP-ribosylglycohydrolase family protein [Treponema sp.]